ncbi:hypothetical protein ACFL6P_06405 [Candidatus Latescibacterota bacterium]
MKRVIATVMVMFIFSNTVLAHHSREYLMLTSYQTGVKGSTLLGLSYDSNKGGGYTSWETTPAVLYSLSDAIMLEAHTHFRKERNFDLMWEAVTFSSQMQVTRPGSRFLDLGVCVSFETPTAKSRDELGGENMFGLRLILSKELPFDANICGNIDYSRVLGNGKDNVFEFIVGGKKPIISDKLECGFEMLGDFNDSPKVQSMFGLYYSPVDNVIIKTGMGPGLTENADDRLFSVQMLYGL